MPSPPPIARPSSDRARQSGVRRHRWSRPGTRRPRGRAPWMPRGSRRVPTVSSSRSRPLDVGAPPEQEFRSDASSCTLSSPLARFPATVPASSDDRKPLPVSAARWQTGAWRSRCDRRRLRRRGDDGRAEEARSNVCCCLSYRLPSSKENLALSGPERASACGSCAAGSSARRARLRRRRGGRLGRRAPARRHELRAEPPDPARRRPRRVVGVVHPGAARAPRQGISHHLLAGAVDFARAHGAPAIEGYPVDNRGEKVDLTMAYVGTRSALRAGGLHQGGRHRLGAQRLPRVLMRLDLR